MNVYVASSWRNEHQPAVVSALREAGHDIYDFRNPHPGEHGFHWSEIDPDWKDWSTPLFVRALTHPIAEDSFCSDMGALRDAKAVVLVLPCGRSAHLEAGFGVGAGKPVFVYNPLNVRFEPELMYKMVLGVTNNLGQLLEWLTLQEDKL